ncbi:MAG TPA: type VI secretion system tube protein TssD [Gaiellaceae bacterium]|jgi:type VI secretion system secreted protein Hcp|nr:type VI secretion system tube protein TssD [Gaiellaceae bacterium]
MAIQAYVKIKGAKQGQFKGEGSQKGSAQGGTIPLLRFASSAEAPRDAASGMASGKRQWQPIRLTKQWGAASPQLLQALSTNEQLTSVVFEFYRPDPAGKQQLHYRVTLQNAFVSSISSSLDLTLAAGAPAAGRELEDVALTFQSIKVEDVADKVTATDDWHEIAGQPVAQPARPIVSIQP